MRDYPRSNGDQISIGNWILTSILLAIPGLNILAGLCYLLSKNKSKRNYVLALIIIWLVVIVLCVALYFIFKQWAGDLFDKIMTAIDDILTSVGINNIPSFLQPK